MGMPHLDPTKKIKIGDLEVPVSLVNDQLQKRLAGQRDRLKIAGECRRDSRGERGSGGE